MLTAKETAINSILVFMFAIKLVVIITTIATVAGHPLQVSKALNKETSVACPLHLPVA